MALVRILVVDDSSHWRSFVLRYFEAKTDYEIIGVAVNGLEAIQKASELRPDVILMAQLAPPLMAAFSVFFSMRAVRATEPHNVNSGLSVQRLGEITSP